MLDADVLVPVMVCDLPLSLFDAELFQPVVSPTILVEVERNLIADFPQIDPHGLRSRVDQMRQALALHVFAAFDVHSEQIIGVNRKDRHVAALAFERRADLVVTNDRRLRPEIDALNKPLEAVSADEFALRLLIDNPKLSAQCSTHWSRNASADRSLRER